MSDARWVRNAGAPFAPPGTRVTNRGPCRRTLPQWPMPRLAPSHEAAPCLLLFYTMATCSKAFVLLGRGAALIALRRLDCPHPPKAIARASTGLRWRGVEARIETLAAHAR